MPYVPPTQRSPAASNPSSPNISRRSSLLPGQPDSTATSRSELPRSASYMRMHRRTPSVKTTTYVSHDGSEPSPPGTADREQNVAALNSNPSLRQSPPPVTDDIRLPTGVILSPPESTHGSSDEEEPEKKKGREIEKLAELQVAIRKIDQRRANSPERKAGDVVKTSTSLHLVTEDKNTLDSLKMAAAQIERKLSPRARKISHIRSSTESSVFFDFRRSEPETPLSGSDEEDTDDDDDGRKPPMLRKKSGELVRPALRPSSRRRPSSMPGTPTFSKAVHFDSHLEHVRHFLQVDRPLAVSAGSSPIELHESDNEFPFSDEEPSYRSAPYEWEIITANFPKETHERLRAPVRVEKIYLSTDNKTLIGIVAVANLAFKKYVVARFTLDYWKTTSEVAAEYTNDIRRKQQNDGYDRFSFNIRLADLANLEAKTMYFCVKYSVNGQEYWDNNNSTNFQVDFRKKAKPQNGKRGMQGAASRPVNGLPKSSKKSEKGHVLTSTFDDFSNNFDSTVKYDFPKYTKPTNDFLGEGPGQPGRLKGVRSAVILTSDSLNRRSKPSGHAFSNRYDFGASLSAAIKAANDTFSDRSGLTMKGPATKHSLQSSPQIGTSTQVSQAAPGLSVSPSSSGTDSPRPHGTEQPVLASDSYNELLNKYCFVRTR
jgi:hypothetical protein